MTEIVDTGTTGKCAWNDPYPPQFNGYICERRAGHYPATPHAALLDSPSPPIYWNDVAEETNPIGQPRVQRFDRAEVEAKLAANDAILARLAQRGVGVNVGDLLMTYVALIVERLFGDMDDQRRLELESTYADLARQRLESTMTAIDRAILTQGRTPSGLHIPNGGPS